MFTLIVLVIFFMAMCSLSKMASQRSEAQRDMEDIGIVSRQAIRRMTRQQVQLLMDFLYKYYIDPRYQHGCAPSIDRVAKSVHVSTKTLYNYIHRLRTNREYHPHDQFVNINRAMSDKLELQLCLEIEREYLEPGRYFNNRILKMLAYAMWN